MPTKKPVSQGKKKTQPKKKSDESIKRFGDSGDEWKKTFKPQ